MQENRWEINRIGLINFWWYDEEIFEFSEGRMILRGTNGSGKSVTMQSFIPLLLDGKKSPERLDPFGNKSRRIEDYVLGYGENEKEENTSYLFMEFQKKETKNYITVGMGLRAKKGQGVKFWGFLIKDGRRIGEDFYLYKKLDQKIPLTKQELKNKIGEGGVLVETQKEYMSMVNDTIFGFQTLEEYDEFIKLLIEIRSPKLSDGKNFKPSIITEIISNSLRSLSDEDLRPVTESLQNMNDTKEQLEVLRNSYQAIEKLKGFYQTYNEAVLYQKAKHYHTTNHKWKNALAEEKNLRDKIENAKKEIEEYKIEQEQIDIQISTNQSTLSELRKDKRFNVQEQITQAKQELEEEVKRQIEEEKKIAEKVKEETKQINLQKRAISQKNSSIQEFGKQEEQSGKKAKDIQYDEYFFRMDEIKGNLEKEYNYDSFNQDMKHYVQRIEQGRNALQEAKKAEEEYDESLQELDKKRKEESEKSQEITKDRMLLEEEKQNFIEEIYTWEEKNELLKMQSEEKTQIAQKLQEYGENSSFEVVLASARVPYQNVKDTLLENRANMKNRKEQQEEEKKKLLEEIDEWKNRKEAEPLRTKAVVENREKLTQKQISYIPFYEAVDFKKNLSEEQKDVVENALQEMGILDALIIEASSIQSIQKQDKDFVDKYLVPSTPKFGHNALELFDIVLPENCKVKADTISNILSNILLDATMDGTTYIDEEGHYKIGLLGGKADKLEKAKYIGKEAKKRYKETKIAELQQKVQEQENIIQEYVQELENIEQKMEILEQEWNRFPSNEKLEEKAQRIKIDITHLQAIREEMKQKEEKLKERFEKLKQVKERVEEATKGIYFNKKLETFEANLEIAKELKDELYELQNIQKSIVNSESTLQMIEEHLEQVRQDLDDKRYHLGEINRKKKTLEEKVQSMEEMIGSGFEELRIKMDECLKLEKQLPAKMTEVVSKIKVKESNQDRDNQELILLEQKVTNLEVQNRIYREILEQELDLKYIIAEYSEIGKITNQILLEYKKFEEKNKSISDYFDTLSYQFRENYQYLTEYNLSMEEMYATIENNEGENLPEEVKEAYRTRNRRDITGFLKGRKVNLMVLVEDIKETIEETESLIEEDDRKLFEDILTNTVGRKIRERIYHAKDWVKAMNNLMENLHTSSGLSFSLKWKPKVASDETEVDTAELVEILNSDTNILRKEEIKKVANHFRSKFAKAEEKSKEKGNLVAFYEIMKDTLDYRNWFEFEFLFKQGNDAKKQLTNNAFYKLSGGEKAMAMYIPLFAAVYARYESAKVEAPRIISLDEAFAGVDDNNIRDCFRILTELDLEYIINSQVLWGEYDTIPSLAINELISDPASQVVSVIRYHWDGKKKELVV
ncbi:MAG: TIGR02680 family protein [Clostridia bacterium]|nr:TIGR02680 family protein [Clostridia bacterium]